MRLMADYRIDSDLCLPDGEPPLRMAGPSGAYELTLANAADAKHDKSGTLAARLIFDAPAVTGARAAADAIMYRCLNALSYTTSRQFSYGKLRQIIDWRPGLSMRDFERYAEGPVWDEAEPELDQRFIATAEYYLHLQTSHRHETAMRWYRRGIAASDNEDQFAYFWFALEVAAEGLKDAVKVASACPKCRTALFCENCGEHPTHKKYAGEAIEQVFKRFVVGDHYAPFKAVQKVRHTLMHGDRISTVIPSLQYTETQLINILHKVAQSALHEFLSNPHTAGPEELNIGYVDDIIRKNIFFTVNGATGMGGNADDPRFDDIPNIEVSMMRPPKSPQSTD